MAKAWVRTVRSITDRPAALFEALGFSPSGVTLLALGVALGSAVFFVLTEDVWGFTGLCLLSGWFDTLDGALARRTGQTTRFGGYLDSVCDRIADGATSLAAGMVTGHVPLMMACFTVAVTTSYAKARAGMEVPIDNQAWPDLLERTERALLALLGLLLWDALPERRLLGQDLFFWWMSALLVALVGVLVQRVLRAKRLIEARQDP